MWIEIECKNCIHYKQSKYITDALKIGMKIPRKLLNMKDCELEGYFTQGGQPLVKDLPYGECDKFKRKEEVKR